MSLIWEIILAFTVCPGLPLVLIYLITRLDSGDGSHGDPL
jgi:hypothetical protein